MVTFDNEKFIDKAVRENASFYGNTVQLTPQQLKVATNTWKKNFSKIVDDEAARMKGLVKRENERLSQRLVKKEDNIVCPVCLDDLLPILSFETRHKKPHQMPCCGNYICMDCSLNLMVRAKGRNEQFVLAVEPLLQQEAANTTKKWLLSSVAQFY